MRATHRTLSCLITGVTLATAVTACLPAHLAAGTDRAGSTESRGPVPMPPLRDVGLDPARTVLRELDIDEITTVPVDGHLFVLNRRNWVVVRQAPRPGEEVAADREVTLYVRKTAEAEARFCFDGDC
ncbi:PASTA domain-containing protein [Saccharomonospora piscinae]|uniref:PASTA domain-containing protein n=1 Tax=Saccharomonospora piscinae TaxID=687388 RepID=UPI0004675BB9|nr:PASTA domain-containing protein [Saccharomonospora piscinae]